MPEKSHFHLMLEDLNVAYQRIEHVASLCSGLNSSIDRIRRELTAVIEDSSKVEAQNSIEQEIAEFIPKHLKVGEKIKP